MAIVTKVSGAVRYGHWGIPDKMVMLRLGAVAESSDQEAIHRVEQECHDDIIKGLSGKRRGRVRWTHFKADDPSLFERIREVSLTDPNLEDFCCDHPGGLVIVTSCEYEP